MSGIDSDVSGIFSAMASMKTEKASKTVIPRPIFSPESGGKQNTRTVRVLIIMHGNTMLYLEKDKINNPAEELQAMLETLKKTMDAKAKTIKIRKVKKDEKRYGLLDSGATNNTTSEK